MLVRGNCGLAARGLILSMPHGSFPVEGLHLCNIVTFLLLRGGKLLLIRSREDVDMSDPASASPFALQNPVPRKPGSGVLAML